MIRDTFTQNVVYNIPESLMNAHYEDLKYIYNRFGWIDNERIKLVSSDGIEKIVHVKNNFKEERTNAIPMYDRKLCQTNHIVHDPPSYHPGQTLQRLIYKY